MFNGFSNITNASLNGLNSIDADEINTTSMLASSITSTNTNTKNLIIDGIDIINTINQIESNTSSIETINNEIVNINTTLTINTSDIYDNAIQLTTLALENATNMINITTNKNNITTNTTDITNIKSDIVVITDNVAANHDGITINGNDIEINRIDITNIKNDIVVVNNNITTNTNNITSINQKITGITYTSPTTTINNDCKFNSIIDLTGTIYIRDPSNPNSVYMKIAYEPSLFGFSFTDETPGRIMNFRVKNANGVGYKLFYFASSQLYAGMLTYIDNWLVNSYNQKIVLGDANNIGSWYGASISYIPNNGVTSGLVFVNKGLNNNATYYTNFSHNNLSNVIVATFRMNFENIYSKVTHTMESNLIVNGIITQSSTTSTNNKIIQNIITDDVTGNQNIFKYSVFSQTSGNTTQPCLVCRENNSGNTISFYTKLNVANYNNSVKLNDSAIISGSTPDNSALVIANHATTKNGIRIYTGSSTTSEVSLYNGTSSILMNHSSAISSIQIATDILTNTGILGYTVDSGSIVITGTDDFNPIQYKGLTHTFKKSNGTDGCIVNIRGSLNLPVSSSVITFPSGQIQSDAFNSNNLGYTKSGSTLTFDNSTNLNLPTSSYITFPDLTQQSTAYTTTLNSKLNSIGGITTALLTNTTLLTTGVIFNCGSMVLDAGTYMITINCELMTVTGTTTISQMVAGYSTSSTSFSQNKNLAIIHGYGSTLYPVGARHSLNSCNILVNGSTLTYYMIVQATFNTAARLQFKNDSLYSMFSAIRIV